MPELRIDPVVGRRVYVAEERAGRPSDFETSCGPREGACDIDLALSAASVSQRAFVDTRTASSRAQLRRASCPFCAGNEAQTPIDAAVVVDAQGQWQVRVVPNKYPALLLDAEVHAAFGAHEVIIESPDHALDVVELSVERLTVILQVYRDRLRHWAADGRLKHAVLFKNSGYAAGASLEHVHSQLVAVPYVAAAVQAELDGVARHRAASGRCLFCDVAQRETAAGERLVLRRGGYVALCAYAPRQPYETWLLPERHAARFDALEDGQLAAQADALHELLRRLRAVSPGAAYNLLLHTAPFFAADDAYHWHWELVPRLTHEAGIEWGGGVYFTPLAPERAAATLRSAEAR